MLCENLVKTQNESLGLSVTVSLMNLDAPRTEEELKDELLAHALDCHECLTVVLFQEDSLSDAGCETYRCLFQAATKELKRQAPIDPAAHITEDHVQAFFWEQLSDEQMMSMAQHLEHCDQCRQHLHDRQDFYLCLKAGIESRRDSHLDEQGLAGVIGLKVPEYDLRLSSHLNN